MYGISKKKKTRVHPPKTMAIRLVSGALPVSGAGVGSNRSAARSRPCLACLHHVLTINKVGNDSQPPRDNKTSKKIWQLCKLELRISWCRGSGSEQTRG